MRIAVPGAGNGLNDGGAHGMALIEAMVGKFKIALAKNKSIMAKPGIQSMLKQMDKYWEKLFCDPIVLDTPTGASTVQPQRTNNILEQFFRRMGHSHRRRTGSNPSPQSMDKTPADLPLVANLDNPDYVRILLGDCQTLEERLAKVDRRMVNESMEMARRPQSWLPRKIRGALSGKLTPGQIGSHFLGKTA